MDVQQLKSAALARRNADDFVGAEKLFRDALAVAPNDIDCAHMLGVLCARSGRGSEAVKFLARAGTLSHWQERTIRLNFGNVASQVLAEKISAKVAAYQTMTKQRAASNNAANPLVSVVVPSYNHAAFVVACLQSVYRQTWARVELIVIDDGSTDGSVELIRESLKSCPFPHQFIARENRGAHATINEAVSLARGEFINILNSDDCFHPQRLERMVEKIAKSGVDWGFSGVDVVEDGAPSPNNLALADKLRINAETIASAPTVGFALLRHNVAVSTGNLFIRSALFREMGGFSALRYVHDWEFVLRATLHSEPVYVADKLYQYRVHGGNTVSEARANWSTESADMLRAHAELLFANARTENPFAPTRASWGEFVAAYMLHCGYGGLFTPETLDDIAAHVAKAV